MAESIQPIPATLNTPILREIAGAVLNIPSASSTTVVRFPAGRTFLNIILEMAKAAGAVPTRAEMETAVANLRLVLSGQELWSITGLQLIAISEYYSEIDTSADGRVVLNFERMWLANGLSLPEMLGPAFGTLDQSSLDIEIDWSGTSTIVAARAYALIDQVPQPAGKVIALRRVSASIGAVGVFQFPDLPMPKRGDFLYAIHIFTPVIANLSRVAYIADEQRTVDIPPGVMNKLAQQAHPPRTPQTAKNVFTLDFCQRNIGGDAVDLGRVGSHVLELTFATAAPGIVPIVCEIATDATAVGANG